MDILYVCGRGCGDRRELRWSLRMTARWARNVGRIVCVGYPPEWLSDGVATLRVPDLPHGGKQASILNCVVRAIDAGLVRGEFLLASDDHFLGGPVDLDQTPIWRKPGALPQGIYQGFRQCLADTRALLEAAGLPVADYSAHAHTRLDAGDVSAVLELVRRGDGMGLGRCGYEPTILFTAVRLARDPAAASLIRTRPDIKLHGAAGSVPDIKGWWSADDAFADDPSTAAAMDHAFPDRSPWERPPHRVRWVLAASGARYECHMAHAAESLRRVDPSADILTRRLDPDMPHRDRYMWRLGLPLDAEACAGVDRLVWLDCDTEIVSSEALAIPQIDLGGAAIGMARDLMADRELRRIWRQIPADERRGYGYAGAEYHNSGVMVIDVARARASGWPDRLDTMRAIVASRRTTLHDQDALHLVCSDITATIPERYNCFLARVGRIGCDPAVIHYTGGVPYDGAYAKRRLDDISGWTGGAK